MVPEFRLGDTVYRASTPGENGHFAVYKGRIATIRYYNNALTYAVEYPGAGFREAEVEPGYLFSDKSSAKRFVGACWRAHRRALAFANGAKEGVTNGTK